MHLQPVAVAHRSLFKLCALVCALLTISVAADNKVSIHEIPLESLPNGFLARIELDSPDEIKRALLRAEELFQKVSQQPSEAPLSMVLHGPEVAIFLKENYSEYKSIVDLAARLSAFEVIDIKVCRTRMGVLGRPPTELVPFVGTVPFGPAEIDRLINDEKFVYF